MSMSLHTTGHLKTASPQPGNSAWGCMLKWVMGQVGAVYGPIQVGILVTTINAAFWCPGRKGTEESVLGILTGFSGFLGDAEQSNWLRGSGKHSSSNCRVQVWFYDGHLSILRSCHRSLENSYLETERQSETKQSTLLRFSRLVADRKESLNVEDGRSPLPRSEEGAGD